MTNDIFMGIGPVALTFIAAHLLSISTIQIGIAISVRELVGSLSQPVFGWLADRSGGRLQAAGGVAWTAIWMMLSVAFAFTGQFWLVVIPYSVSALGSGAFHPVGAMYAADVEREQAAGNTAYFFLLGQLGIALAPALAGVLLEHATANHVITLNSVTPLFALTLIVVPSVLFMAWAIPRQHTRPAQVGPQESNGALPKLAPVGALLVLGVVIILRSVAHLGLGNFIPVLFARKGWEPGAYGLITSLFWLASALSGIAFGYLADRYDVRRVLAISLWAAAPTIFLLPLANGPLAMLLAILVGVLAGGSFPIVVVLAQIMFPMRKGFASGLSLGFIFTAGALGSLFIGLLADGIAVSTVRAGGIGLGPTMQVVSGLAFMAGVVALRLPAATPASHVQPMLANVEAVTSGD